MGFQKLPVQGALVLSNPFIPGTSGTNALTGAVTLPPANEISITRFLLSGAAITLDGVNATVTLASHLNTFVGQQVTFSGATISGGSAAGALNNYTWTIGSISSSSVYTFPCALTGTVGGTIVQEPVFTLPQGFAFVTTGANAIVEYCADNGYNSVNNSAANSSTWRTLVPVSLRGMVASDGFGVRLRCNGTTATTTIALVA